jgi:CheY-like chemotaxis protein
VVEDESLVAILLEDMLGDLGCAVVGPAANVTEALALVHRGEVDFALLDVNLGDGATSFVVADHLRACGVPFAFVTGYGVEGVRPDLRYCPVVSKPIDVSVLARVLGV